MQNAPIEHSAILFTFIKLPFVFKTIVLSIFEWSLKTGFTVVSCIVYSFSTIQYTKYNNETMHVNENDLAVLKRTFHVNIQFYTTLTNSSTKYLVMSKVYTDVGGIK